MDFSPRRYSQSDRANEMKGQASMKPSIKEIHKSLINGQREQMIKQIKSYGLYNFWPDYQRYLSDIYVERGDRYMYFSDAVISYFRITAR